MRIILPFLMFLLLLSGTSRAETLIVYKTIAYEASGESLEAQAHVAKVIQNRAIKRGLTAEEVCLERKQFSCWNEGINSKMKPRTEREIENAKRAWRMAYELDLDIDHYHDTSVLPYWAKTMRMVKQIDSLKFYAK